MEWIIRDALPTDARDIARLSREDLGYDYPEEATREKLEALLKDGRNKILVAEKESQVVGYVHLVDYDVLYAPHMKNVIGIAVSLIHISEPTRRS